MSQRILLGGGGGSGDPCAPPHPPVCYINNYRGYVHRCSIGCFGDRDLALIYITPRYMYNHIAFVGGSYGLFYDVI